MKSKIFIISGPSGSGKNSVCAPLRKRDDFVFSVSCTTRPKRPDEIDGKDYHFMTGKEFDQGVKNSEFLEWEPVFENKYGTRKNNFDQLVRSDKNVIALLDVKGAMNIRKNYSNVITIFIMPPSLEEAAKRLEKRQTENDSSQTIRKARYDLELNYKDLYNYVIVNDDLAKAQDELQNIVKKETLSQV